MRSRGLAIATALLLLGGCDSPGGPDPNAHVGRYTIAAVNGEDLPFLALVVDGRTTEIMAGSVTLNASGTASDTYTYRYTDGFHVVEETTHDAGSYTRNGEDVAVTWSSGVIETFSYGGDELTLLEGNLLITYRK